MTPLVTVVGHPFAPIGMGEHARATFRALRAACIPVRLLDVHKQINAEAELERELRTYVVDRVLGETAVFCINGDEVARTIELLGMQGNAARRIIYPAWELPESLTQKLLPRLGVG